MDHDDPAAQAVRVGTAGWDYKDWRGNFFPERMPRGVHPLTYLASYFDAVEVNATFYRPARPEVTARWVQYVADRPAFSFTVKVWQRFTHERDTFPGRSEGDLFKAGLKPLAEAGRLGGLLVQFPWSFRNLRENRDWLERVLDLFEAYPIALEVRHASWNLPEVYALLRKRRVAICNIDQPLYRDSIAPDDKVTARLGYVRLHGQNYADWFRENAGRDARYNYLYTEEELEPWVKKVQGMRRITERLYVITNNHYRGQAAVNALQLAHLITGRQVKVPDLLARTYPQLNAIRTSEKPPGQGTLFKP